MLKGVGIILFTFGILLFVVFMYLAKKNNLKGNMAEYRLLLESGHADRYEEEIKDDVYQREVLGRAKRRKASAESLSIMDEVEKEKKGTQISEEAISSVKTENRASKNEEMRPEERQTGLLPGNDEKERTTGILENERKTGLLENDRQTGMLKEDRNTELLKEGRKTAVLDSRGRQTSVLETSSLTERTTGILKDLEGKHGEGK